MRVMLFLLLTLGCSGSDEGDPCDLAHRDGTYLQSFRERAGGTCGPVSDQVFVADSGSMELAGDCAFDAPDSVSADQCKLTRQISCLLDGAPGTVSGVGVTTERDGGARIEGTFTARIYDASGALVCVSTYDTVAVRQ